MHTPPQHAAPTRRHTDRPAHPGRTAAAVVACILALLAAASSSVRFDGADLAAIILCVVAVWIGVGAD